MVGRGAYLMDRGETEKKRKKKQQQKVVKFDCDFGAFIHWQALMRMNEGLWLGKFSTLSDNLELKKCPCFLKSWDALK